jgi:hypothetical protein
MTDPPRRFKEVDELTVEEHAEHRRSGRTQFETDEYIEGRRMLLADGGYEDPDAPKGVEDMTPADHANAKYGERA